MMLRIITHFSFKFDVRFILARGRRFVGQWPVIQWVYTVLPQYHRRKAFRRNDRYFNSHFIYVILYERQKLIRISEVYLEPSRIYYGTVLRK